MIAFVLILAAIVLAVVACTVHAKQWQLPLAVILVCVAILIGDAATVLDIRVED